MKRKPILLMAASLLLLLSCDKKEPQHLLSIDHNTKQIVFFSNDEALEQEVSYYDAIIELKNNYPEEMKNLKILSASELDDYSRIFEIDHCPALLVFYQNKVIAEIEGTATKEEVIAPIAKVLSGTS